MSDLSKPDDKPTPWWMKFLKINLFYFGPMAGIVMLVPYFSGKHCPELEPSVLIIGVLMFGLGIVNGSLTLINSCKLNKPLNPEP